MTKDMFRLTGLCSVLAAVLFSGQVFAAEASYLIANSDDLDLHRTVFAEAAVALVDEGTCSEDDFIDNGGWVRSTSFKPRPIYFMYCGGATVADRLYLDANTGEVFR